MKEVTVNELKLMKENQEDFQLIDVRESNEFAVCNLGGVLIPLSTLPTRVDEISRDKKIVIHCKAGGRSAQAIHFLEQHHGFTNLYNLQGGILAWAKQIDPSMPTY
jgi:rhodanese-related sulfurtransferase